IYNAYSFGSQPGWIIATDFDNDTKIDVAYTTSTGVAVRLGNGNGTLGAETSFRLASFPSAVTSGDYNGDGRLDIAVSENENIQVLLNNSAGPGSASFLAPSAPIPTNGIVGFGMTTGDFNKDGNADIAVANSISGDVSVLLGNGAGGFQTAVT